MPKPYAKKYGCRAKVHRGDGRSPVGMSLDETDLSPDEAEALGHLRLTDEYLATAIGSDAACAASARLLETMRH